MDVAILSQVYAIISLQSVHAAGLPIVLSVSVDRVLKSALNIDQDVLQHTLSNV